MPSTVLRKSMLTISKLAGVVALTLGLLAATLQAELRQLAMDQVHWVTVNDRFFCKLELNLEKSGALAFVHAAGEPLVLRFRAGAPVTGEVAVASRTAPWLGQAQSRFELLEDQGGYWQADAQTSQALMNAMDEGLWTLVQAGSRQLLVPTIRWSDQARDFRLCQQALSPMSVRQARDQVLYFERGQQGLRNDQLELLDRLARYVAIDTRVSRVLVDAHTDATGSRLANLQISRTRAADVASVLREAGVPATMIEKRAHGQRYPTTDNATAEGRNLNRRVTIRVIRKEHKD